jgi:hypothetical protein
MTKNSEESIIDLNKINKYDDMNIEEFLDELEKLNDLSEKNNLIDILKKKHSVFKEYSSQLSQIYYMDIKNKKMPPHLRNYNHNELNNEVSDDFFKKLKESANSLEENIEFFLETLEKLYNLSERISLIENFKEKYPILKQYDIVIKDKASQQANEHDNYFSQYIKQEQYKNKNFVEKLFYETTNAVKCICNFL